MIACSRVRDSETIMPRQPIQSELSEFGLVLDEFLKERGWSQTQLSTETDPEVSQGQLSNYRYGRRNPKPETISVLARALTPRQADRNEESRAYHRVLNRLRHAAGLRSLTSNSADEIEYEIDPDIQMITEAYSGATPSGKRAIKSAAELALEMSREGSIGKRAE